MVRLELRTALVERERVPEHADGGIGRREGKPLGDEPDGAHRVPVRADDQSDVGYTDMVPRSMGNVKAQGF